MSQKFEINTPLCPLCNTSYVLVYCGECDHDLCETCFNDIHHDGGEHADHTSFQLLDNEYSRQRNEEIKQEKMMQQEQETALLQDERGNVLSFLVSNGDLINLDEIDLDTADVSIFEDLNMYARMYLNQKMTTAQLMRFDKQLREQYLSMVKEQYEPLHKDVYTFDESFLDESFLAAVKYTGDDQEAIEEQLKGMINEESPEIWSFRLFNEEYCAKLIEEVDNFEKSGITVHRPNSMNNYGCILDEIGMEEFFQTLMTYLAPLTSMLFPDCGGDSLDHHHAFTVQYKLDEDLNLDFHTDDAEVTINVCLGKQFKGGSLYFKGIKGWEDNQVDDFDYVCELSFILDG